jgi:diguanylate cyclase (GGDEF)-like protein
MNHPDALEAQVARGAVDLPLEGRDYLEHRVLGMGRAVPGTQWHVISKQDRSEVLRDLWTRTLLTSLGALGFVAVTILSIRFWLKQRVAAQIQAELESQANTDRLTGLPNRRSFDTHIHKELRRLLRHLRGQTHSGFMAVAILDVDHFKLYNDTYGHLAGDACLRSIAEAIQGCIARPGDLACRFGGEEFILVMPDTDEAGALVVAESARARVERLGRPHASSPVSDLVTISAGAAALQVGEDFRIEQLIEWADQALYAAKKRGRNQVAVHSDLVGEEVP